MSKVFRKPKTITEAQRAAAQANGAKSHGPVTDEGKAKSALNAVNHGLSAGALAKVGLSSSALVLTTESRPKFDGLLQAYREEYDPQGQTENDLVEELTAAKWLQKRCFAMQTALLDIAMDRMEPEITAEFEEIDNAARTALAFLRQTHQNRALDLLNRYASRHARDYHRALDKLRLIQQSRDRKEAGKNSPNEPKRVQPQSNQNHPRPSVFICGPKSEPPAQFSPPPDASGLALPPGT